ncbi:hypothetical protein RB195_023279 [Necator americanus]|uniref:Uncharacterized protein n=1 Tax=Necator americanus TaxID=51031 RepID=A0ABR1EII6_NECAM
MPPSVQWVSPRRRQHASTKPRFSSPWRHRQGSVLDPLLVVGTQRINTTARKYKKKNGSDDCESRQNTLHHYFLCRDIIGGCSKIQRDSRHAHPVDNEQKVQKAWIISILALQSRISSMHQVQDRVGPRRDGG